MKIVQKILCPIFGLSILMTPVSSHAASSQACTMCEYIWGELDEANRLGQTLTEDAFIKYMDKMCPTLTTLLQNQCNQMRDNYGYMIYELIQQGLSPTEGCEAIGLCDSSCTCTPTQTSSGITGGTRFTTTYSGCNTCPANKYSCGCNADYTVQNQGTSSCSCTVYCGAGKYYSSGNCTICSDGTYKSAAGNATSCTKCPSPGTTSGGADAKDSITDCYQSSGSDSTGAFTYSPVCHYTE